MSGQGHSPTYGLELYGSETLMAVNLLTFAPNNRGTCDLDLSDVCIFFAELTDVSPPPPSKVGTYTSLVPSNGQLP